MNPNYTMTKAISRIQPILDADHPFSLGWKLILATDSKLARRSCRVATSSVDKFFGTDKRSQAVHAAFDDHATSVIVIRGGAADKYRLIELVVHEVSHFVDDMFMRVALTPVHTETRAYHMDWIVGKAVRHFKL